MHEPILDALRRGAHDEALVLARAAVDADAGDATAHHLMAQALRMGGDQRGALEAIDRALAASPDDAGLHFHRAGVLLGGRSLDEAREELKQAIALDPNQFGAYLLQAELELVRGDLDEAERLVRIAARIAPDHPVLGSIEAMVVLRRGDQERALALITAALAQAPDEPQVLNAAGFIYLHNGNLAFAEQAFRRLRERKPDHHALRRVLAELLYEQGRHDEALEEVGLLLDVPGQATPETLRFAGELALHTGDAARALGWLRSALAAMPADPRVLELAMQAWARVDGRDDARNALDALLATSPGVNGLWQARFSVETAPGPAAAVLERWMAVHPGAIEAHEARLGLQLAAGERVAAEATLRRILELRPDEVRAQGLLVDLLIARDPAAAVAFARDLVDQSQATGQPPQQQWRRRAWLGHALAVAGDPAAAAEAWTDAHTRMAATGSMLPLPGLTSAGGTRTGATARPPDAPALAFLAGLPGSGVIQVARLLESTVGVFRGDRFGPNPPSDPLQTTDVAMRLAEGSLDPAEVAEQWRQALPARGLSSDRAAIDWLLLWDNALLDVIGPHLPQARVLVALRDPRDMLVDWLALGDVLPLRMESPQAAAQWLAQALEHVAELEQRNLHPHTLLRLDPCINAPQAMAGMIGEVLGTSLPAPPGNLFGGGRYAAGQWRSFATPLAAAFATLAPVAVRLGYPPD